MKKKTIIFTIVIIVAILGAGLFYFRGALVNNLAAQLFLKAGKPLKFGEYTVLIDRIDGNKLYGIKVSAKDKKLEAKSGDYEYLPDKHIIKFNLIDGIADDFDPGHPGEFHRLTFKQSRITMGLDLFTPNSDKPGK